MIRRLTGKITKVLTCLSLAAIVAAPVMAQQTSASNTIETNKKDWVTSMSDTKVTNQQETSFTLFKGIGHDSAINYVKVGAYLDGTWKRVIGPAEGIATAKTDVKATYNVNPKIGVGTKMRIRLKLSSLNTGYSTDKVAMAWYWN